MGLDLFLFLGLGFVGVVLAGLFSGPEALVDDREPNTSEESLTHAATRPTLVPPVGLDGTGAAMDAAVLTPAASEVESVTGSRPARTVAWELVGLLAVASLVLAAVVAGSGWLIVSAFRAVAGF